MFAVSKSGFPYLLIPATSRTIAVWNMLKIPTASSTSNQSSGCIRGFRSSVRTLSRTAMRFGVCAVVLQGLDVESPVSLAWQRSGQLHDVLADDALDTTKRMESGSGISLKC